MVKKIANNDMTEVLAEKVALVDFSATWCGPCQMLAPVVDALAEELEGQVAVYNVDVDANSDLAMQYRVMSVPSLLLFKDGQVAGQTVGYMGGGVMLQAGIHYGVGNGVAELVRVTLSDRLRG